MCSKDEFNWSNSYNYSYLSYRDTLTLTTLSPLLFALRFFTRKLSYKQEDNIPIVYITLCIPALESWLAEGCPGSASMRSSHSDPYPSPVGCEIGEWGTQYVTGMLQLVWLREWWNTPDRYAVAVEKNSTILSSDTCQGKWHVFVCCSWSKRGWFTFAIAN